MRLADYVVRRLADLGISHTFMLTGGGAMHLNDAIGREARMKYICCHHEQACAIAAEAYSRISGMPAIVNVTTGPGGINSLNGVFGAFTDSIPMIVLSGQVKRETCLYKHHLIGKLRQLGDQEADIAGMVKGITKYAVTVDDPASIRYHVEKAFHLATTGRPGPCWLDIPIDVQASTVNPDDLTGYRPEEDLAEWDESTVRRQCRELLARMESAQRPVLMVGSGVHVARAYDAFEKAIRRLSIPVTTAWTAVDLLDSEDPLYCGRPGVVGNRAGNFTVQNADLVVVVGCRLAIRQASYNWASFARHAFMVQVDIDKAELDKPMVRPHLGIQADCRAFLEILFQEAEEARFNSSRFAPWLEWCKERVRKYPVVQERHRSGKGKLNPYHFTEALFDQLRPSDVIACGDASASVIPFQAARIKRGQRLFTNAGSASMGYDLPAAVGAAFARPESRILCLAGDGSLMLNLQEFQTVVHHQLPIKIIVYNNDGYLSIRSTQNNFFHLLVGEGPASGVTFPDYVKVGAAFGLRSLRIEGGNFSEELSGFLNEPGPGLLDVILDPDQPIEPKLSSRQLPDGRMVSSNLEDMAPFLDREEFKTNLLFEEEAAAD
jgi:acetolactate synthase-1/2/3 large subunit